MTSVFPYKRYFLQWRNFHELFSTLLKSMCYFIIFLVIKFRHLITNLIDIIILTTYRTHTYNDLCTEVMKKLYHQIRFCKLWGYFSYRLFLSNHSLNRFYEEHTKLLNFNPIFRSVLLMSERNLSLMMV